MKIGDYIDYLELARLYDIKTEVFYEVRHMMVWLERLKNEISHSQH